MASKEKVINLGVRGHTLTQARKGYDGTGSEKNTAKGHVFFQSKSGKTSGESGGFASATGRGLKKQSK